MKNINDMFSLPNQNVRINEFRKLNGIKNFPSNKKKPYEQDYIPRGKS